MFVDHWLVFDACMKSGMCVTPINEHQAKNASLFLNVTNNNTPFQHVSAVAATAF